MTLDEQLVERVRIEMQGARGLGEKRMFGGVAYLVNGNMACGVIGDELIVRVGPDQYDAALAEPHTRVFDFTGRVMKGWVVVAPAGFRGRKIGNWVARGKSFAAGLPPRVAKKSISKKPAGQKPARK